MKAIKPTVMLLTFLLCTGLSACKKSANIDDLIEEAEEVISVSWADLRGKYQIQQSSQKDLLAENDWIWDIQDEHILINCQAGQPYTYANNLLTINDRSFTIVEKEKGKTYLLNYEAEHIKQQFVITTSDSNCPDTAVGEEDPETSFGTVELDKLYGYGLGTTGGEGALPANIHHFDDGNKFRAWLAAREKAKSKVPAIVWLSGTFTKEQGRASGSPWFDIKETENISIYGTHSFRMENIGFFIVRSHNIILRNLYIKMPKADNGADGISMQKSSQIWVDHCTFESINQSSDYEDGSCDITHATTHVTVSWNHFIKTQKTALVGHSDGATEDVAIKATFHHNYFDRSSSRHPRVRYGTVHVYNNFFNAVSTYGVGSAMGAKVLVEGNYYEAVHLPTDICTFPAKKSGNSMVSNLTGKQAGFLYASENVFENIPKNASDPYPFVNLHYQTFNGATLSTALTRADFAPPYSYIMDMAQDVPQIVSQGAGVGVLPNFAQAPIAVDNGNISILDPGNTDPETNPNPSEAVELGNGWFIKTIGTPDGTAAISGDKRGLDISGRGKFESAIQAFTYVYTEVSGDFEISARLQHYQAASASNQALAGLLFTPDVEAEANNFVHAMSAKGGKAGEFNYSRRLNMGQNAAKGVLSAPSSSTGTATYLKLRRVGKLYYAAYSLDGGLTYSAENSATFGLDLAQKIYVGLAVNSGHSTSHARASFTDIKINGQVVSFDDN